MEFLLENFCKENELIQVNSSNELLEDDILVRKYGVDRIEVLIVLPNREVKLIGASHYIVNIKTYPNKGIYHLNIYNYESKDEKLFRYRKSLINPTTYQTPKTRLGLIKWKP